MKWVEGTIFLFRIILNVNCLTNHKVTVNENVLNTVLPKVTRFQSLISTLAKNQDYLNFNSNSNLIISLNTAVVNITHQLSKDQYSNHSRWNFQFKINLTASNNTDTN